MRCCHARSTRGGPHYADHHFALSEPPSHPIPPALLPVVLGRVDIVDERVDEDHEIDWVELQPVEVRPPAALPVDHMCDDAVYLVRSEEHQSELQSLMRISYAVFCLINKP